MFEIWGNLASSESPKKCTWHRSLSNCVWLALVVIGYVASSSSMRAQTSYGSSSEP